MKKHFSFTSLLIILWLLLSGHLEPLMLGFAALSISLTLIIAHRMDVIDHESHPLHLRKRLIQFWIFLGKEIILANLDVIRRIILPGKKIDPHMLTLSIPQQTDLGRVMYANAITLTPGTVSVRLSEDTLVIHALTQETAKDLMTERLAQHIPEDART